MTTFLPTSTIWHFLHNNQLAIRNKLCTFVSDESKNVFILIYIKYESFGCLMRRNDVNVLIFDHHRRSFVSFVHSEDRRHIMSRKLIVWHSYLVWKVLIYWNIYAYIPPYRVMLNMCLKYFYSDRQTVMKFFFFFFFFEGSKVKKMSQKLITVAHKFHVIKMFFHSL